MRVDEIIASKRPTFSVEFFPPRDEEKEKALFETARELRELEPDFVSVTYGAGGSTRDGTVEITRALKDELGFETMAHLSCVGETT
jgi:methylenetetrahydrofolate reductase (NADPH)